MSSPDNNPDNPDPEAPPPPRQPATFGMSPHTEIQPMVSEPTSMPSLDITMANSPDLDEREAGGQRQHLRNMRNRPLSLSATPNSNPDATITDTGSSVSTGTSNSSSSLDPLDSNLALDLTAHQDPLSSNPDFLQSPQNTNGLSLSTSASPDPIPSIPRPVSQADILSYIKNYHERKTQEFEKRRAKETTSEISTIESNGNGNADSESPPDLEIEDKADLNHEEEGIASPFSPPSPTEVGSLFASEAGQSGNSVESSMDMDRTGSLGDANTSGLEGENTRDAGSSGVGTLSPGFYAVELESSRIQPRSEPFQQQIRVVQEVILGGRWQGDRWQGVNGPYGSESSEGSTSPRVRNDTPENSSPVQARDILGDDAIVSEYASILRRYFWEQRGERPDDAILSEYPSILRRHSWEQRGERPDDGSEMAGRRSDLSLYPSTSRNHERQDIDTVRGDVSLGVDSLGAPLSPQENHLSSDAAFSPTSSEIQEEAQGRLLLEILLRNATASPPPIYSEVPNEQRPAELPYRMVGAQRQRIQEGDAELAEMRRQNEFGPVGLERQFSSAGTPPRQPNGLGNEESARSVPTIAEPSANFRMRAMQNHDSGNPGIGTMRNTPLDATQNIFFNPPHMSTEDENEITAENGGERREAQMRAQMAEAMQYISINRNTRPPPPPPPRLRRSTSYEYQLHTPQQDRIEDVNSISPSRSPTPQYEESSPSVEDADDFQSPSRSPTAQYGESSLSVEDVDDFQSSPQSPTAQYEGSSPSVEDVDDLQILPRAPTPPLPPLSTPALFVRRNQRNESPTRERSISTMAHEQMNEANGYRIERDNQALSAAEMSDERRLVKYMLDMELVPKERTLIFETYDRRVSLQRIIEVREAWEDESRQERLVTSLEDLPRHVFNEQRRTRLQEMFSVEQVGSVGVVIGN
ncbi:hypothetical protein NHQ30_005571 [Ciborinia camelliae]|nr:hypothetical protein NHQ30_005571 [Ciborinia camelliae]